MFNLQVLVVDDEDDLRDVLCFFIKAFTKCDVDTASNGDEALKLLSNNNYDIIFSDYSMPIMDGGELFKFVLDKGMPTRFVLCSTDGPDKIQIFKDNLALLYGHIQKPDVYDDLNKILHKLKLEKSNIKLRPPEEFIQISARLLLSLRTVPCDLFLKLAENHYVKAYDKNSEFEESDFHKLNNKNIQFVYAGSSDAKVFTELVQSRVKKILGESNQYNKLDKSLEAHRVIMAAIRDLGFNEDYMPLIEQQIEDTIALCRQSDVLSDFLAKLIRSSESYNSKHSFLMAAINVVVTTQLGWTSSLTQQKLVLSSFFHDIFLGDQIEDESKHLLKFSEDPLFLNHSLKASEALDKESIIPPDVSRIVFEHHEVGEIYGVPNGTALSKILPLSQLFTFCHFFTDLILNYKNGSPEMDVIYTKMDDICGEIPQYKKFLSIIKEINFFA